MHSKNSVSTQITRPMTPQQAAGLVGQLLGSYPSLTIHDPETYLARMTTLLCRYSLWVGERAINDVINTSKYIPVVADVKEACDRYAPNAATMTWAQQWDAAARLQLAERDARERVQLDVDRARVGAKFRELLAKISRGRDDEFTPASVVAKYGLTQEQWNALPDSDAGANWRKVQANHARQP